MELSKFQSNAPLQRIHAVNRMGTKQEQKVVLPKSTIGKAIGNALDFWGKQKRYVEDGRYLIDNNSIENNIRPVALGRKNYLFAGNHEAAQNAAMIYSFLGTCKKHKVNPNEWLVDILERLPDCKTSELENLLPQNWKLERNIDSSQNIDMAS